MNLKHLFAEEDAVSPVIGVILMVAITVILAAVIGTFVLGLGENVQDSAPQANFQFEYTGNWDPASGTDDGQVTITHTGGEDVDASTVSVNVGSAPTVESSSWTGSGWADTIDTGSSVVIAESGVASPPADVTLGDDSAAPGESVRVIWTSPSGGTSNTIGQSTIPS